jgi:3-hydroxyisobutyrate dehydrogenase-like beta-hydroxyacid dehydrogenase
MGAAIARRLIGTGHLITVYNRHRIKTRPFANRGVAVASTPKQLAQHSDLILISVTNFVAVKEICFGNEGMLACNSKDFIVADTSTISPEESKFCAQRFREANIAMLAMPVMGGITAAENGELVPIICGNREAFEKVAPIIKSISKAMFYVGERDGDASILKLALNLNIGLIAGAMSEGIALARGAGIEPNKFIEILNSTSIRTQLSEAKGPKMIANNFEPSFYLKNMLKDLDLAVLSAQSVGVSLPLTALMQQMYRTANNSGYSEQDYTAIAAFLMKINGMDIRDAPK